jgi:hypothetical protein
VCRRAWLDQEQKASVSDQSSFDLSSAAAMLVVIGVLLTISIRLVPVLLQMVWQVLPGILVLWLIVTVLRGMVKHLLG